MSYADISTAVGIRKARIHYHFPSKEDLLASLLERYTPSFFKLVDRILESSSSAEIKLRGMKIKIRDRAVLPAADRFIHD